MKINTYFKLAGVFSVVALIIAVLLQSSKIKHLKEDLSISIANEKALFSDNDSLKNNSRILSLSIANLNYLNDSIIKRMNDVRKELKIKDRDIKELQYQLSTISKKDTVVFRDTLFKDTTFSKDTSLVNSWYTLKLSLRHPSTIIVNPSFKSERFVSMYLKKETIRPPKKCKIARAFQKKHKIMEVIIEEKNPYIIIEKQKYIKIIE